MSTNSEEFLLAADTVKKLKKTPNDNELLELYGVYKQATMGDNNQSEPGFLDFKGKSKHASWLKNKGKDKYDSEVEYITIVNNLINNYGVN
jgi:diazepam-binding inhibitor (GABA receptor modulator, acyl-CoA-binding protein)